MPKTSQARVLVVEDVELEAKLLMRALADFGYTNVVRRPDVPGALAEIETNRPRIVVTDLMLGDSSGIELTRRLRARAEDEYIYVIMLTGHTSDRHLRDAFNAGVDDFVTKPFRTEEMVARMRAGERIVELETTLRARSRELETALRRIDVAAAQRALARAQAVIVVPSVGKNLDSLVAGAAWTGADEVLSNALAEFFQLPCQGASIREDAGRLAADVFLSEPARSLEIGITVLVDEPSMRAFAAHLLGDGEDLEGAKALVLETGNIMMGVLKSAFLKAGHTFTGSIPSEVPFAEARASLDSHSVRHRVAFSLGDAHIEVWLRAKEKESKRVLAKDLEEGMVVGEDVHDKRGMLLIRAGSRLTRTAVDRIARIDPLLEIMVGDPGS